MPAESRTCRHYRIRCHQAHLLVLYARRTRASGLLPALGRHSHDSLCRRQHDSHVLVQIRRKAPHRRVTIVVDQEPPGAPQVGPKPRQAHRAGTRGRRVWRRDRHLPPRHRSQAPALNGERRRSSAWRTSRPCPGCCTAAGARRRSRVLSVGGAPSRDTQAPRPNSRVPRSTNSTRVPSPARPITTRTRRTA
jgi:hypothetical protein